MKNCASSCEEKTLISCAALAPAVASAAEARHARTVTLFAPTLEGLKPRTEKARKAAPAIPSASESQ